MVEVFTLYSRHSDPKTWNMTKNLVMFLSLKHFYHFKYSVCSMILMEIIFFPNLFSGSNQTADLHVAILWSLTPIQTDYSSWEHKEHFYQLWMLTLIHYPSGPIDCILGHALTSDRLGTAHSLYGNPLQYSCLENPRDGGAWCAAVYGVTQSWTRLKRLSTSSSTLSESLKKQNQ